MQLINLNFIAQEAIDKENENIRFRSFLKQTDSDYVDDILVPIAAHFTKAIDCTACGNCCKSIMISVDEAEINQIAIALNEDAKRCKQKYFDFSNDSEMILINAIPCHFLTDNKCTVYKNRPSACASFPHLDLPNFTSRLYSMLDGYGVCPIIYHSMEELKVSFNFK